MNLLHQSLLSQLANKERVLYYNLYLYFAKYIEFCRLNHSYNYDELQDNKCKQFIDDTFLAIKAIRKIKCSSINVYDEHSFVFKNFIKNTVYNICIICPKYKVKQYICSEITLHELLDNYYNNCSKTDLLENNDLVICKLCGKKSVCVKKINSGLMNICNSCENSWLEI